MNTAALQTAERRLSRKIPQGFGARLALVAGSGLAGAFHSAKILHSISYSSIPYFPRARVPGHAGELLLARLGGKDIFILSGRAHYYEGFSMDELAFPVRLLSRLGVRTLILTAAVGALSRKLKAGELLAVRDHINLMGENPLRGQHNPALGEQFPDLSECYSSALLNQLFACARKQGIPLRRGIYLAVSGPSYETPAEVRAFRKLGADVVGMSLVPEAVAAHQAGLSVLAVASVANSAAGLGKRPLRHSDVIAAGAKSSANLARLLKSFLRRL